MPVVLKHIDKIAIENIKLKLSRQSNLKEDILC